MTKNTLLKKLFDAGAQFTETSQASAERVVSEFVKVGAVRRKDAEKTVQKLIERGRSSSEQVMSAIQAEVSKQLARFADRIDVLESRLDDMAARAGLKSTSPTGANVAVVRDVPPAPVAEKQAPTKTAAAEQAAVKKAPVKKAPVKKAPVKKAPAKKASGGSSGVAKVVAKKATKR
jgi:polyhydroxyalkanoate synthesis regulator phasin